MVYKFNKHRILEFDPGDPCNVKTKEYNKCGIVICGAPGSGKSKVSDIMSQIMGIPHISTGEIARSISKNDTELCSKLNNGEMFDESTMRAASKDVISNVHGDVFILDGMPRFPEQYEWLMNEFCNIAWQFFVLSVPYDELMGRLSYRERNDDNMNAIRRRMWYYHVHTLPMIASIHGSQLHDICADNTHTPCEIANTIVDMLVDIETLRRGF